MGQRIRVLRGAHGAGTWRRSRFPDYDLRTQFVVMRWVPGNSAAPVPTPRGLQEDGTLLGATRFVMDEVLGEAPQDNPPYVFHGWTGRSSAEQRGRLRPTSAGVLVDLHSIAAPEGLFGELFPRGGSDRLREHVDAQHANDRWALADDGVRGSIMERGFSLVGRELAR